MIPKVIHYCWFGGKPIPRLYCRYLASWSKFMPDYEIVRWDESNFDVNQYPFTRRAYLTGKMALVSDYVRLKVLYDFGGVYLDTDVELLKSLDDLLADGGFMGFEKNSNAMAGEMLNVNIGLGAAVPPRHPLIKEVLDYYDNLGDNPIPTIVTSVTAILRRHGLASSATPTTIDGITYYPADFFCPIEFLSSRLEITDNTHSIHHYSASWMTWRDKLKMKKGYYANKIRKTLRRLI